ncbi:MAG: hypothetical protein LW709_02755 [Oxalobacteraceae bacterium]|jgi:hypothetical protein|nr:hypothetical protein [Oxalobacteraceae bacterium]MCE2830979.1 hypothetical protein [Oxalobacteraceae bacterium]
MNTYYETTKHSSGFVAVRESGTKYAQPGKRIKATPKLRELAKIGAIPTLSPIASGLGYL